MYADIIVDITHEKLDKIFQYRIPKEMEGRLQTGMEVLIPFGRANRETKGYVIGFSENVITIRRRLKRSHRSARIILRLRQSWWRLRHG